MLEKENITRIKEEDKKAGKSFAIILLIATCIGGITGFCTSHFQDNFSLSSKQLIRFLATYMPFAGIILLVLVTIISSVFYKKALKQKTFWSGDIDKVYETMERYLCIPLFLTSTSMIVIYTLFGADFVWGNYISSKMYFPNMIANIVMMLYCMIFTLHFQKKVINLEKEINPEKQGSIYDMKFQDKWMNSCDEWEQLMIYKCAYKAYNVTSKVCLFLWIVTFFTGTIFHTGIMPILIIGIIWLVLSCSYQLEAARLGSQKKRTNSTRQ